MVLEMKKIISLTIFLLLIFQSVYASNGFDLTFWQERIQKIINDTKLFFQETYQKILGYFQPSDDSIITTTTTITTSTTTTTIEEFTLPRTDNVQLSHTYTTEECIFRWTYENAPWKRCEPTGICYLEYKPEETGWGIYSCSEGICTFTFTSLRGYSLGDYIHTEWICDGQIETIKYQIIEI